LSSPAEIRKIDTNGIITAIAGNGIANYGGDGGPASASSISSIGQLSFDENGNLYYNDELRIRKINTAGIINTVAGNGTEGNHGDGGPATAAQLFDNSGVFADKCDNFYIADYINNKIRIVNGAGIIHTFAGTGFGGDTLLTYTGAYSGDGGPAINADLYGPSYVYLDRQGNVYFADLYNNVIRCVHMDSCRNTVEVTTPRPVIGQVVVIPNPNTGSFTLNITSSLDVAALITITNMVGQVVKQLTALTNKEQEVQLSGPPGVYFITASTAQGRWSGKVVVE